MTWNARYQDLSPAERGRLLREQGAAEDQHAQVIKEQNMSKEKSVTGIVRRRPDRQAAEAALAAAHEAFTELLDAAQTAMERESRMKSARSATTAEDARRAPVLNRRR